MKVVCINPKPNNKDSDHLRYGQEYEVLQSYTSTLFAPPSDTVSVVFFLISLPSSPPKRYLSDRFTKTKTQIEEAEELARQETREKINMRGRVKRKFLVTR